MAGEISRLFVVISASTREFMNGMDEVQTRMKKLGGNLEGIGKSLTAGLTAPLLAVGAASFKAVQLASDLAETQAKVGQIFGDSGKEIESFASTAATALGQSKQQAMDASANFAIFGKSAGLSGTELVGFSTELTVLASDLASFNNTSPEVAIDAIGAALRGEAEPLRAFGVLMDDASLRSEALKMGLIATTKEALTPQQKVLAAHALVMAQTTTAQGDFARTSEGLANQQRILKAELTNTTTELGVALLPIALQLVDIFRTRVAPAIQGVSDWFTKLSPNTQKTTLIIAGLTAIIGPLLIVAGFLVSAIAAISLPVLLVIAGIAALIAIGVLVFKNWEEISAKAREIWGAIVAFLKPAIDDVTEFMTSRFEAFAEFWREIWPDLKEAFVNIWNAIKEFLEPIVEGMLTTIKSTFDLIVEVIKVAWQLVKDLIDAALKVIQGILKTFAGLFTGNWEQMWEGVSQIFEGIWDGIKASLKAAINVLGSIINSFIDRINSIQITIPSVNIPGIGQVGGGTISFPKIPRIPSLAIGTDQVNSDGLAMLHEGEMVMPADVASGGFSGGNGTTNIFLDGRMIASVTAPHMVKMIRQKTGLSF